MPTLPHPPGDALQVVLLDVDGTLIDSNDAHARAWAGALAAHGYVVPFDRVRPLIGMGGDKLLPIYDDPADLGRNLETSSLSGRA